MEHYIIQNILIRWNLQFSTVEYYRFQNNSIRCNLYCSRVEHYRFQNASIPTTNPRMVTHLLMKLTHNPMGGHTPYPLGITQDRAPHPQDSHPPSPERSHTIARIVTHHPLNGHPTSLGRSATILRTVSHHLQDNHTPAPGWSHSYKTCPPSLGK